MKSSFWVALLASTLVVACEPSVRSSEPVVLIDADAVPQLTLVEEMRIGSLDDVEYSFSNIARLTVGPDGRLYVTDLLDRHIRVFSPEGGFLHNIGRRGQGPGEFQSPIAELGFVGDTLWVIEPPRGRITLVSRDGELIDTARVPSVVIRLSGAWAAGIITPESMNVGGLFPGIVTAVSSNAEGASGSASLGDTIDVPRIVFSNVFGPGDVLVDTVGWYKRYPPRGAGQRIRRSGDDFAVPQPPVADPTPPGPRGSSSPILVDDGHWIVDRPQPVSADPSVFRLIHLGLAGDTMSVRTFSYRPQPYAQELLDSLAVRSARIPGIGYGTLDGPPPIPDDWREIQAAILDAMDYPEFQLPVQGHRLGEDGTIWLRRDDSQSVTISWLLLDPSGEPIGQVDVPGDMRSRRVLWSRDDVVWATELDEFDVPWLIKYTLR